MNHRMILVKDPDDILYLQQLEIVKREVREAKLLAKKERLNNEAAFAKYRELLAESLDAK